MKLRKPVEKCVRCGKRERRHGDGHRFYSPSLRDSLQELQDALIEVDLLHPGIVGRMSGPTAEAFLHAVIPTDGETP